MKKRGVACRRWKQALANYWGSGLSLAEYCRQHELNYKNALRWHVRLRRDFSGSELPLEIVQLPSLPFAATRHAVESSGVKLEFGVLGVRLDPGFDIETLRRVLAVLEVR